MNIKQLLRLKISNILRNNKIKNIFNRRFWTIAAVGLCLVLIPLSVYLVEKKNAAYRNKAVETLPQTLIGGEKWIIYARNYLEMIYKKTEPKAGETIDKLDMFASPGEYEPTTFTVFTTGDVRGIEVTISDLSDGKGNIISSSNITLRMVKYLNKRRLSDGDPKDLILLPEFLNYYKKINLLGVNIFRQYWLIVYVPEKTVSGDYQGIIKVSTQDKGEKIISLKVEVLPIKLREPEDKIQGIYYSPKIYTDETANQRLARIEAELTDIKQHGARILALDDSRVGLEITKDSQGEVKVNYEEFKTIMDLIKDKGFRKPIVLYLKNIENKLDLWFPQDSQKRKDICRQSVEEIKRLEKERNWPEVVFEIVDEPFMDSEKKSQEEKIEKLKFYGETVKSVPGTKIFTPVVWNPNEDPITAELDKFIDIRSYWGRGVDNRLEQGSGFDQLKSSISKGDGLWFYYNDILNKPEIGNDKAKSHLERKRAINGFYFWNSPFTVHIPWTYQALLGDAFNDSDGDYSDTAYMYPDAENSYMPGLPSLRWEAFREGVDDLKYLYTLEKAIEEKPNSPYAQEGRDLLAEIKNKINEGAPTVEGIVSRFGTNGCQDYRYQVAKAIIKITGN